MECTFKVIYILISNIQDFYYEQLLISISSFKHYNKNIKNILLCDLETYTSFINNKNRKNIFNLVDEFKVIEFNNEIDNKKRSRLLKTRFRNEVDGDLLFIDCDTLVINDLSPLQDLKEDLYMVLDTHNNIKHSKHYHGLKIQNSKANFGTGFQNKYFNSGVIYVKDNEKTREFFNKWLIYYLKGYKISISNDQPSLNYINNLYGGYITELDGIWNCQTDTGIQYLYNAKIMHYLGFNNDISKNVNFSKLCNIHIFKEMKNSGVLSLEIIDYIRNPQKAIKPSYVIPLDSALYTLLTSNTFRLFKKIFFSSRRLFSAIEKTIVFFKNTLKRFEK